MEDAVKLAETLIRRGYRVNRIKDTIKKRFPEYDSDEIYEIARCRIDMGEKYSLHTLYFDRGGLRYSTPEIVGRYRARRIRGFTVADISCGAGMQAIFFSYTNSYVLCVDINPRRIRYARLNANTYGVSNIEFMVGDALSDDVVAVVKKYDIIFSDPARPESEMERKLESLKPSPIKVMDVYGDARYIFDLPPQIRMEKLPKSWEKEYISVDGRISRLTAYTGDLRIYDRSAVSLPSGSVFGTKDCKEKSFILSSKLSDYIYIVDESLYYSHLLGEFAEEKGLNYLQVNKRRTIATSDELLSSPFLKAYVLLCKGNSLQSLVQCLKENSIGRVTLRFKIEPKHYWKIRSEIESMLNGEERGTIFRINDLWIGVKNVT